MEGPQKEAPAKREQPRVGVVVQNKLSGKRMMIDRMQRTRRGRAWVLRAGGREFVCHVDQFDARYTIVGEPG